LRSFSKIQITRETPKTAAFKKMAEMILSVDIGTSSIKAALIDFDGALLAFSRAAYERNCAQSAEVWERAFVFALKELVSQAPGCTARAICISGNGPTLVPVMRNGEALPPLYWNDSRTSFPGGSQGREENSLPEPPSFFLPHAAWLKENSPGVYKSVDLFFSSHEWLSHRLGAETYTALPRAAYEPYYWDEEQCCIFGIEKKLFPPFVKTGSIVGQVSAEAASFFGAAGLLKAGTPIIAGAPDFISALIGTAVSESGDVCDRAGSSEGINVCAAAPPGNSLIRPGLRPGLRPVLQPVNSAVPRPVKQPVLNPDLLPALLPDPHPALRTLPHALEGLWNISALIPRSGRLFDLYKSSCGRENQSYTGLLEELIPPGSDVDIFRDVDIFPLSGGDSAFSGASLAVSGSGVVSASPLELGRSVLCSIGFAVRDAIAGLEQEGLHVKEMRVSGGQGKNMLWNQLKADITGVSLLIPEITDGELTGNAVIAAAAFDSGFNEAALKKAMKRMIRYPGICVPRNSGFWNDRYGQFVSRRAGPAACNADGRQMYTADNPGGTPPGAPSDTRTGDS